MDTQWREHLQIPRPAAPGHPSPRYASKNPKQEYKRGSFETFGQMLDRFRGDVVRILLRRCTQAVSAYAASQMWPISTQASMD